MEAIYRYHPMFAERGLPRSGYGGVDEDWGPATSRAAT